MKKEKNVFHSVEVSNGVKIKKIYPVKCRFATISPLAKLFNRVNGKLSRRFFFTLNRVYSGLGLGGIFTLLNVALRQFRPYLVKCRFATISPSAKLFNRARRNYLTGFILLTILFIGFIVPMFPCSHVPTFPCSNVPMFQCSNDAFAWTPPASPPPGGNVAEPLNTGDTAQGKTGNLGIGTASPTTKLDVWGNIETTGAITIDGRMTASEFYDGVYYLNPADNTTSLNVLGSITAMGTTSANYFAGNVGIGSSSPGYKLDVNGSLNATSIYINGAQITGGLWTSGSGLIYYNSGNVGIGTTSPDTLLTIANNSWISGKNSAGTGSVNMFKVNTSDEIDVGGTLNIGTLG
ncbi:hypothetical protein KKG58_03890, partial [Patescibacteria group bacterium]|nr:hypothetical protein [Patescibacteria group bacterium]